MQWLFELIRTFWPIAAFFTPVILGAGILWMRSQFPTKTDAADMEDRILARIDGHDKRLDEGSGKMADFATRIALVESDCESSPSKSELNQSHAVLAGRMSGVESTLRGLERAVGTQNDYLHTLIEKGLGK